jgi:hypothetical protein
VNTARADCSIGPSLARAAGKLGCATLKANALIDAVETNHATSAESWSPEGPAQGRNLELKTGLHG